MDTSVYSERTMQEGLTAADPETSDYSPYGQPGDDTGGGEALPWKQDDHESAEDGHDELLAVDLVPSEGITEETKAQLTDDHTDRQGTLDLITRYCGHAALFKVQITDHWHDWGSVEYGGTASLKQLTKTDDNVEVTVGEEAHTGHQKETDASPEAHRSVGGHGCSSRKESRCGE